MNKALLNVVFTAQSNMAPEDAQLVTGLVATLSAQSDNPQLAAQWHLLAEIARTLSLFDDARVFAEMAHRLEPHNQKYLLELARDYQLADDLIQAMDCYRLLLELSPGHAEAEKNLRISLLAMSESYEKKDDFATANFYYQEYLRRAKLGYRTHILTRITDAKFACAQGHGEYRVVRPAERIHIPAPRFPLDDRLVPGGDTWSPEVYIAILRNAKVIGGHGFIVLDDDTAIYDKVVRHHQQMSLDYEPGCLKWQIKEPHREYGLKGRINCSLTTFRIDAAINLVGAFTDYYAHWVMDFLPKLWLLDQYPEFDGLPLLVDATMPRTHFELLRRLGAGKRRAIIRLSPYDAIQVKRLVEVSHLWTPIILYCNHIVPEYSDIIYSPLLRDFSSAMRLSALPSSRGGERLFLSRRNVKGRRLRNRLEIERIAREHGYRVVLPEKHSMQEQLRMFAQAKYIVGVAGSAFANLIFAGPGTRALLITVDEPSTNYHYFTNIGDIAGVQVHFVFADLVKTKGVNYKAYWDMRLGSDKFRQALVNLESAESADIQTGFCAEFSAPLSSSSLEISNGETQ